MRQGQVLRENNQPRHEALWEGLKSLLFLFGTAILTTIAVRNSVNPYIRKFWGASHDFWGELWGKIYDCFGRNDVLVYLIGTPLAFSIFFVVFNAVFLCCDITGKPAWLIKYKVQESKNQPVDHKKLWSCIKTVGFNMVVVSPLVTFGLYPLAVYLGSYHTGDLPSFERLLLEFVVSTLVEEVLFYYSHRLFHTPRFYARFHKKHHEWTAPIGITSVYCDIPEMVLSVTLPVLTGPLIMQSHLFVAWIWIGLAVFSTTLAHGGYHVPFLFSPEAHDYHHKVFNCWFGTIGILDKLHKTDKPFCGSVQEERHYVSFSLTPVKEIHPTPAKPSCASRSE